MARQVVVYDDFSGGEWGSLGEYKAKPNMWSGMNMYVNRLGELMCRPGLYNMTPSGPAPAVGVVHGFGVQGVPGGDVWYIQGTAVRSFGRDHSIAGWELNTLTGALAETPSEPVDVVTDTNQSIFASASDKLYRVNTVANTCTGLTGSPGAKTLCIYGPFVVAGDIDGSVDRRLRFSADSDPNSWPTDNFIDFGDNWSILGLHAQRQHLMVCKQAGYHIMTGYPGVNSVTRAQVNAPGPYTGLTSCLGPDDVIAVLPGDNTFPAFHNGSTLKTFEHLDNFLQVGHDSGFPASHGIAMCNGINRGFYFFQTSGNKCIAWNNKVWSYHTFGVTTSGFVSKQGHGEVVMICDGGGAATAPKFYTWNPHADTPGIVGGSAGPPGDDSNALLTGNFDLPEYWDKSGDEFVVRSVIVDYRFWNTGASNTNHFDLQVEAKNLYGQTATVSSNTVSVDSAQASSSASGSEYRSIHGFGEQGMGNGFQLHFTNCRGLAVKRITVVLDVRPVRV